MAVVYIGDMIENLNWQPSQYDIDWTYNHVQMLSHNALWGVPCNDSIWRLDKINRVFCCIFGRQDYMFERITVCCQTFGYRTEYKPEQLPPHIIAAHLYGAGKSKAAVRAIARN